MQIFLDRHVGMHLPLADLCLCSFVLSHGRFCVMFTMGALGLLVLDVCGHLGSYQRLLFVYPLYAHVTYKPQCLEELGTECHPKAKDQQANCQG